MAYAGGMDPRLLPGKPEKFNGRPEEWVDFKDDFLGYVGLFNRRYHHVLSTITKDSDFPKMSDLGEDDATHALTVYHILKGFMAKKGKGRTIVRARKDQHGLLAWRDLCKEFDPKTATQNLGSLGALMEYDFGELWEIGEKLLTFETAIEKYEKNADEIVTDSFKKAVLQKKSPKELKDHVSLNADNLDTYHKIKQMIENYLLAQAPEIEAKKKEYEKRHPKKDSDDMDVGWDRPCDN